MFLTQSSQSGVMEMPVVSDLIIGTLCPITDQWYLVSYKCMQL